MFQEYINQIVAKNVETRKLSENLKNKSGNDQIVRIYASFKINYRGEVDNIKIKSPLNAEGEEAIKDIFKSCVTFTPAFQNGFPVNILFMQPIIFRVIGGSNNTSSNSNPFAPITKFR